MGRQKTKYTKTDACIYILYCILNNEFNTLESLTERLDVSVRQLKRYISEINLTMDDFNLQVEVIYNKNIERFIIK
ncbi:helix-turn-helix domain-containing protein [Thomasclavelia cocleata]|mgnify:CR=1 FL=1|uniref:helix-turn-helix domain-containing protein n=1 Tax=Thomasclavelia cocleata TaxID=69824 RepID=UPI00258B4686|nr:helix-turn-helix domain-containing protein [Thomasclavelia cocleata]